MARGDIVRCGPSFLLIWSRSRQGGLAAFPIVAQTRPITRADFRVPGDALDALGLPHGPAWIIALRKVQSGQIDMRRIGTASPHMLRLIGEQLHRVGEVEHFERMAAPAWS